LRIRSRVCCHATRSTFCTWATQLHRFQQPAGLVEVISAGLDGPIVRGAVHTHGGATLRMHGVRLDELDVPALVIFQLFEA
jgi:hypothetical protein